MNVCLENNIAKSKKDDTQYTKRVFSNSLFLLLRMFFVTLITLWSVRFALNGLGLEDYGVYNALAGIVLSGTFIIQILAISLQRFYSYALGIEDKKMLSNLFSVSLNITFFLIIIFAFLLETIGLWYVNSNLVVSDSAKSVINIVYQMTALSFLTTVCLVPFTAVIFSHENMRIYALFSSLDCILKCLLAFSLVYISSNKLVIYSLGLLLISIIMLLIYGFYTLHYYDECKYHKIKDINSYKQLLSFTGWTSYGAITGTATIQGSAMVLNFFFGPLANAAFAVANNLYNAFNSLASSMVLSFRPAMTKLYAQGDKNVLNHLFYLNNKLILYSMWVIALPVISEIPLILKIWLGESTYEMILFSRFFIFYTVCLVLHNPISTIVQSTGNIKRYSLIVETIMLCSLPIAILFFYMGLPSWFLFVSLVLCCSIAHALRLFCLKEVYPEFHILAYIKIIIIRGIAVYSISTILTYCLHNIFDNELIRFILVFLISPILVLGLTSLIGLSYQERILISNLIKRKK